MARLSSLRVRSLRTFLLSIALLASSTSSAATPAATERHFAECRTIRNGVPVRLDFYEELDAHGRPTGRGRGRMTSRKLRSFVSEMSEEMDELPELTKNRVEVQHEPKVRGMRVYTAHDPNKILVAFDMPIEPKLVEIDMKTPSDTLWGRFQCINLARDCAGLATAPE